MNSWGDVGREGSLVCAPPGWNSGRVDNFDRNLSFSKTSSSSSCRFCWAGVGPRTKFDPSRSSRDSRFSWASTISTAETDFWFCEKIVSDSLSWSVSESETFSLHLRSNSGSSEVTVGTPAGASSRASADAARLPPAPAADPVELVDDFLRSFEHHFHSETNAFWLDKWFERETEIIISCGRSWFKPNLNTLIRMGPNYN